MYMKQLSLEEIREIYNIYLVNDFPKDEVKPLSMIEAAYRRGGYLSYGYFEEPEELRAYAFFLVDGDKYLLDYYAVREEFRGMGFGSRFIRELAEDTLKAVGCALLEIEDPAYAPDEETKALRESRRHFYMKNGLRDTGAEATVFGVEYKILEFPGKNSHSLEQIKTIYTDIYLTALNRDFVSRMIKMR